MWYWQFKELTAQDYIKNPHDEEAIQICSRVCTTVKRVDNFSKRILTPKLHFSNSLKDKCNGNTIDGDVKSPEQLLGAVFRMKLLRYN